MEHQEIIIRLIKDHLVNTRLINGLYDLGIYMDDYHLHLSDTTMPFCAKASADAGK